MHKDRNLISKYMKPLKIGRVNNQVPPSQVNKVKPTVVVCINELLDSSLQILMGVGAKIAEHHSSNRCGSSRHGKPAIANSILQKLL